METAGDLIDAFRSDVVDTARPYFWSDDEVMRYADAAYNMFVRLTGGIPDFVSEACSVDIVTGEAEADLHPSILRIMTAERRSDNYEIKVVNATDRALSTASDYGKVRNLLRDDKPGPVTHMVHGMQRGRVRWLQVPVADDVCDMVIYRLPLKNLETVDSQLEEVAADHHIYLLDWMKHLAYKKQDADTYDPQKSKDCAAEFEAYCRMVKAEWERYKSKVRKVTYGGL